MSVLTDVFQFKPIQVESDGGKAKVRGIFGVTESATNNDRIYRTSLMEREINKLRPRIESRSLFGELDHPNGPSTKLQRVSHIITDLRVEGNEVYGEAEVLDTPSGKILKAIFEAGASVGVSSRGVGSIKNEGGKSYVADDYELVTFDFVADPAAVKAWPEYVREEWERYVDSCAVEGGEKEKEEEPMKTVEERLAALRASDPDLIRALEESIKVKVEADKSKALDEMKSTMEARLQELLEEKKSKIEESVKSRLESDPSVAGAKAALESVVSVLRPFVLDEDARKVVELKEAEIRAKDKDVSRLRLESRKALAKARKMEEAVEALFDIAEGLAMHLFVEKRLSGVHEDDREKLRQMIGEADKYDDLDALKEAIGRSAKTLHEEYVRQMNEERKIKELKAENKKLREAVERSVDLSKAALMRAYFEQRVAGSPQASALRKAFDTVSESMREQADVDAFVAAWQQKHPVSESFRAIAGKKRSLRKSSLNEHSARAAGGYGKITVAGVELDGLE